jgi:putative PIN family toxin of toxin-antitoxin system
MLKAHPCAMLASEATNLEIVEVLSRPKFDRYVIPEIRRQLASEYIRACESIHVHSTIRARRDSKDNKSLELAVNGRAGLVLTGDLDLLALHPFRKIAVLSPAQYLAED